MATSIEFYLIPNIILTGLVRESICVAMEITNTNLRYSVGISGSHRNVTQQDDENCN